MKHLLKTAAIACMVLIGASCKHDNPDPVPVKADFSGTVTVTYRGTDYDTENIKVNFTPSADGKTADILIYAIKFVPQMPVTLDITVPGVSVTPSGKDFLLSGENLIPLALGGQYPNYTVTGLSGKISGDQISFSLMFGDYPTSYKGTEL
jgi:hypothetical protein